MNLRTRLDIPIISPCYRLSLQTDNVEYCETVLKRNDYLSYLTLSRFSRYKMSNYLLDDFLCIYSPKTYRFRPIVVVISAAGRDNERSFRFENVARHVIHRNSRCSNRGTPSFTSSSLA